MNSHLGMQNLVYQISLTIEYDLEPAQGLAMITLLWLLPDLLQAGQLLAPHPQLHYLQLLDLQALAPLQAQVHRFQTGLH